MVQKSDTAKLFRDEGYEAQAQQWQEGWFAGMNDSLVDAAGTPQEGVLLLPADRGLPYVLAPNAKSAMAAATPAATGASSPARCPISGRHLAWCDRWYAQGGPGYRLRSLRHSGPGKPDQLGDRCLHNDYLKAIDPNVASDQMQAPATSSPARWLLKIIPDFDNSELSAFLAGQNSYAGFAEAAPSVNAKLMQDLTTPFSVR